MTKAALQWLEAEFSDVWVVFALGGLDQLWPDESAQINRVCHCENPCWSCCLRSIALPRPSHAVGSNGGEGPDPVAGCGLREAGRGPSTSWAVPRPAYRFSLPAISSTAPPPTAPAPRSGYSDATDARAFFR